MKKIDLVFKDPAADALWHHPEFHKLRVAIAHVNLERLYRAAPIRALLDKGIEPSDPRVEKEVYALAFGLLGWDNPRRRAIRLVEYYAAAYAMHECGRMSIVES